MVAKFVPSHDVNAVKHAMLMRTWDNFINFDELRSPTEGCCRRRVRATMYAVSATRLTRGAVALRSNTPPGFILFKVLQRVQLNQPSLRARLKQ